MNTSGQNSPPTRMVIVADDLTSATDCGVQMMTGGYRAFIPLRPDFKMPGSADIVALDTDSRNVPPHRAYGLTRDAVAGLSGDTRASFYKSIDSTLRGNLGAELDAVFDSGTFDAAIIAPAFPTYGRTTINGQQLLNGRPIHETEFGSDPTSPVTTADIATRFGEQSRRSATVVSLDTQNKGAAAVFDTIVERRKAGDQLFIFDAAEERDLERISTIIGALPGRFLWVGSTGLSRYVPKAVGLIPHAISRPFAVAGGCVLIIAGSASETTRAQLDACGEIEGLVEIRVESQAIAKGEQDEQEELKRVRRLLQAAVCEADVVAFTLTASRHEIESTKTLAAARGFGTGEIESYLAHTLARLTAEMLNGGATVKGLVLTGGTTAKLVVSELQADAIEILEEIEPGIPLGRVSGTHDLLVVTKAGGFGGPKAIFGSVERIAGYGRG